MELGSARARPIAMPATLASSTGTASGPTQEQETADCRAGSAREEEEEEEEETFGASFGAEATCAVAICVMRALATCGQGTVSLGMPQTPGVVLPTGQERRIPGIQRQKPLPCAT